MPILTDNMETRQAGGTNFSFSARKIDENLGASEYTLAFIAVDATGSLYGQEKELENMIKVAVNTCRKSPRSNNLMLMVYSFSGNAKEGINEIHGFKPLSDINDDDYTNVIQCGGMTPLNDAAYSGLLAIKDYGADLTDHDYAVNGIGFVITDGEENCSKVGRNTVRDELHELVRGEHLESFKPVLVGFNTRGSGGLSSYLQAFKDEAGFDQYVDVKDADQKNLDRLASFISQSISSQSQSLGSGGVSQNLTF